jgi:DNA-binding NarL/FixJ family response regulator
MQQAVQVQPYFPMFRKTCMTCGAEFSTADLKRKCFSCRKPKSNSTRTLTPGAALTPRENQLLALVAEGHANKEIAARLFLSEGTIKVYMNRLFVKLGVSNRTQLAIQALKKGLLCSS